MDRTTGFLTDPVNRLERRYLTIMFCDLVNSTHLATMMDPEDLLYLVQAYRHLCAEIINRYDGFVASFMGDGIMSFFGYPRAHEDDAERAVRSALDLLNAVKTRKAGPGEGNWNKVSIRIGIASGLVVVGNSDESDAAPGQTVIGETPNLAARLQAVAQPGTAIVCTETRSLVHGSFKLKCIGTYPLRGYEKARKLWRVVNTAQLETRTHASRQELVGRSEELDRLIGLWKLSTRREGRAALISGELGTGKSKLLETLCEHVAGTCSRQLRLRCSSLHANGARLPELAQLLDADGLIGGASPGPGLRPGKPETAKPCLVMLEDAHRISPAALAQLNKLILQVRGKPVLLAITHRTHFRLPGDWYGQQHVETIHLAPLNRTAATSFIHQFIGERQIPSRIISAIIADGDGIPLFLEELTRAALQTPRQANGKPQTLPGEIEIPKKVRTVLMAKLDQQPPSSREAAQIGAALGREFRYYLLAEIWSGSRDKLDHALHSLCRSGVLVKTGDAENASYMFKWVLMREVAYQSMLRRVRQNLHRRIIRAMVEYFPDYVKQHRDTLDYHHSLAGVGKNY